MPQVTCPVHVFGEYMCGLERGQLPFAHISPDYVRKSLRALLAEIGVPSAEAYVPHDMRRGHAEDLRCGGATLGQILRAGVAACLWGAGAHGCTPLCLGDWRSPAFLHYLDQEQLEMERTVEVHHGDSSDESGGELQHSAQYHAACSE